METHRAFLKCGVSKVARLLDHDLVLKQPYGDETMGIPHFQKPPNLVAGAVEKPPPSASAQKQRLQVK